jgi:hypothetical protein
METMTLLEAVASLELMEQTAVSWITLIPTNSHHMALFTIAFLLPILDGTSADEYGAESPRFWPHQKRLLERGIPIKDQIVTLHQTGMLGNLASVYLPPRDGKPALWIIETHAGSDHERLKWIEAVIAQEGRSPWRESRGRTESTLDC